MSFGDLHGSDVDLSKFLAWLRANDREFWANKVRLKEAVTQCHKETGLLFSQSTMGVLRKEHGEYWGIERLKAPTTGVDLSEMEWAKLSTTIRRYQDELRGQSVEFLIRFLRLCDVPVNRKVLCGSEAYKEICRASTPTA